MAKQSLDVTYKGAIFIARSFTVLLLQFLQGYTNSTAVTSVKRKIQIMAEKKHETHS